MNEINYYISHVSDKQHLNSEDAQRILQIITNGGATPVQISALFTAFEIKGLTVHEVLGFISYLYSKSINISGDLCYIYMDQTDIHIIVSAFLLATMGYKVVVRYNIFHKHELLNLLRLEVTQTDLDETSCLAICGIMFAPHKPKILRELTPLNLQLPGNGVFKLLYALATPVRSSLQILNIPLQYLEVVASSFHLLPITDCFLYCHSKENFLFAAEVVGNITNILPYKNILFDMNIQKQAGYFKALVYDCKLAGARSNESQHILDFVSCMLKLLNPSIDFETTNKYLDDLLVKLPETYVKYLECGAKNSLGISKEQ